MLAFLILSWPTAKTVKRQINAGRQDLKNVCILIFDPINLINIPLLPQTVKTKLLLIKSQAASGSKRSKVAAKLLSFWLHDLVSSFPYFKGRSRFS
jgi:hypothetical protein